MTHVDADVLLIDEVLAVGDADFQEKCEGVFRRMHDQGRTIVLVTHSMPSVNVYCERAMLIHEGRVEVIGDPEEVSNRYLQVTLRQWARSSDGRISEGASRVAETLGDPPVRIVEAWLADADGNHVKELAPREPIELHAIIEARRELEAPVLVMQIDSTVGQRLFFDGLDGPALPLDQAVDGRLHVRATIENRLVSGRYVLSATVFHGPVGAKEPASTARQVPFEIGGEPRGGLLALDHQLSFERPAVEVER